MAFKKVLPIVFLLLFSGIMYSQITTDHKLHFGAGAVISGATYTTVYLATKNKKKAFWYSFGTAVTAGLAKELYDSGQKHNKFDTSEWAATALGGLTVSVTINLFVGDKKRKKQVAIVDL